MNAWVVRGGRGGEGIGEALDRCSLTVGFGITQKITDELTWEDVWNLFREERSDKTPGTITNWTNEMWDFRHVMQIDDYVIMPHPHRSGRRGLIAIGRITGEYEHRPESALGFMHVRKVEWTNKEVPRFEVSSPFENSIRRRKTVSNISEHIEEISELLGE